jgi:hypothetical protein
MRHFIVLIIIVVIFPYASRTQNVLLLERPGTTKYFMYKVGKPITVTSVKSKFPVSGEITMINDSAVAINDYRILLSDIKTVTRYSKFLFNLRNTLFGGVVLYFGFSVINHSIHNEHPVIDRSVPVVCGSLIAAGGLSHLFKSRIFVIGKPRRLRVINLSILKVKPEDFH